MAYTDAPDPIVATLTNQGRNALARATIGDISVKIKGFAVGREGYVMGNPVHITALDPSQPALVDQFFPLIGRKNIETFERPYPTTLVVNCKIKPDEFVSALGELGVWVVVVNSSIPAEIGTEFLFAIAHFPIITKTYRQALLFRLIIQF